MKTSKYLDSSIELLKQMLGDANNEWTSEQRNTLTTGTRELKRMRKAKKFTHKEVSAVVSLIAQALYEVAKTGEGA
jgi:hypothetical protein